MAGRFDRASSGMFTPLICASFSANSFRLLKSNNSGEFSGRVVPVGDSICWVSAAGLPSAWATSCGHRTPLANHNIIVAKPKTPRSATMIRTIIAVAIGPRVSVVGSNHPYNTVGIRRIGHKVKEISILPVIVAGAPSHEVAQPLKRPAILLVDIMTRTTSQTKVWSRSSRRK